MPIFNFAKTPPAIAQLIDRIKPEVLQHHLGNEKEKALPYVNGMYKELEKPKQIDNLLSAVIEEGKNIPNKCCVAKNKNFSNDLYLFHLAIRFWRWEWIKPKTRLEAIPECQFPFSAKAKVACINPYHYQLIKPKFQKAVGTVTVDSQQFQDMPKENPRYNDIMNHCYQRMPNGSGGYGPPNAYTQGDEMADHYAQVYGDTDIPLPPLDMFAPDQSAASRDQMMHATSERAESPSSSHVASPTFPNSPNSIVSEDFSSPRHEEPMETDEELQQIANNIPEIQRPSIVREDVAFCEPAHWVSFTYYERKRRVGPPVDARSPYMLVDGFTNCYTDNRISLGYFTNPQRDSGSSRVLLNIGRGARFYYLSGEVFVECLSSHPIYVQSPNCNQRHGWHAATVCQVPTGCNLKIFSYAEFQKQLGECIQFGFDAVYALTRICTVRISFAKGWGCVYKRQKISATPCWIEAHLNGALEWVDKVLAKMGAPNVVCTSFS